MGRHDNMILIWCYFGFVNTNITYFSGELVFTSYTFFLHDIYFLHDYINHALKKDIFILKMTIQFQGFLSDISGALKSL